MNGPTGHCFYVVVDVFIPVISGGGGGPVVRRLSSLYGRYCAFCDRSMKLSTVFLYTMKFVFRCGTTSEFTSGTCQRPNQIWPPSAMIKIQLFCFWMYMHM